MSAKLLLDRLHKLLNINQELLKLGKEKIEALKANNLQLLEEVIKNEQRCIAMMRHADEERMNAVLAIFKDRELPANDPTITDCIAVITDAKLKEELSSLQNELLIVTYNLQNINDLNQQLLKQSLQFVNITLDSLNPQRNITNYESKGNIVKDKNAPKNSMFDSKA
ncbi:MAG: flagellar protein [Bacillales bacterium]|jgi:flagellar biosynthesis/type III secretory pathway chaperone|nr:flagellar protein [Bacillales bacterium]